MGEESKGGWAGVKSYWKRARNWDWVGEENRNPAERILLGTVGPF